MIKSNSTKVRDSPGLPSGQSSIGATSGTRVSLLPTCHLISGILSSAKAGNTWRLLCVLLVPIW